MVGFLSQDELTDLLARRRRSSRRRSAARASAWCSPARSPARSRRRLGHRGLSRGGDPGDRRPGARGRASARSSTPSRRCSPTSRAGPRWGPPRGARERALLVARHRTAPRGDLRARDGAEARRGRVKRLPRCTEPLGAGRARARLARRRGPRDLVARPGVEHGLPRLRLRQLALGRRRRPPQPRLRARPRRCRGTSRSGRPSPSRSRASVRCSPRSGSACSGTPCCPARAGELARVAVLRRHLPHGPRDERDAARHRLRAPPVRPLPGRAARRVGPRDREDPALGGHGDRGRRPRRARPLDGRPALRPHRRVRVRRHRHRPRAR